MAWEIPLLMFSPKAGGDLRLCQFMFVKLSADNTVVICAAATDIPIGVLQNAPNTGETADVMIQGISKVVNGTAGALAYGVLISTDSAGKAIAQAQNDYSVGQTIEGAAAQNGLVTAAINCANMTVHA